MRLIDADALIDNSIELYCKDCDRRKGIKSGEWRIVYEIGGVPCRACGIADMQDYIEVAPTIEPKRGHWIYPTDETMPPFCSRCKAEAIDYTESDYCPNCGAKMEAEQDEKSV